jgi:hypothetical protein
MIDSEELQFYYSCKSKRNLVCGACTIRLFAMVIREWNSEKRMYKHKSNDIDKSIIE